MCSLILVHTFSFSYLGHASHCIWCPRVASLQGHWTPQNAMREAHSYLTCGFSASSTLAVSAYPCRITAQRMRTADWLCGYWWASDRGHRVVDLGSEKKRKLSPGVALSQDLTRLSGNLECQGRKVLPFYRNHFDRRTLKVQSYSS